MINQIIIDGSDSGSPKRTKIVVMKRRRRIKKSEIEENEEKTDENSSQNKEKTSEKSTIFRLEPLQKRGIRFVDQNELRKQNFRKLKTCLTCKIERERIHKINGTRTYFKYSEEDTENVFIAKAKFESSEEIPINEGNDIHLSSKCFYAKLLSKNKQTLFSLHIGNDETPTEDIQFMLSRTASEGSRRMSVFIYPDDATNIGPITLESKNATEMPNFGKLYRTTSVKNALLCPVDEDESMISIRKTSENSLEIDTMIDITSVQLFAIGIASFLGKTP